MRMEALGHRVMEVGPTGSLVFCCLCGCYTEANGRNLQKPCKRQLSTQWNKIPKMKKGLHPVSKDNLGEVRRVCLPCPPAPAPLPVACLGMEVLMQQVTMLDQFARPEDAEADNFLLAQQEDQIWAHENFTDDFE